MDQFEKDVYTGKIRLLSSDLMENIMTDIKIDYSEDEENIKRALDVFLSINLSEKDYLVYQLRKRKHKLDDIGECFGVKKAACYSRLKRINKKIEELIESVKRYHELQNKLSELDIMINKKKVV